MDVISNQKAVEEIKMYEEWVKQSSANVEISKIFYGKMYCIIYKYGWEVG